MWSGGDRDEAIGRAHPLLGRRVVGQWAFTGQYQQAHPLCRLEVKHARTTIVRYSELIQVILELAQKHRMAPALAARLAERLASSQTTRVA